MVESSVACEVMGMILAKTLSFGSKRSRILMVESSDAGDGMGRFFIIKWSFGPRRRRISTV